MAAATKFKEPCSPLDRHSTGPTVHWSERSTEKQQDEWQQPQTVQSIGPTATVHWFDS